eukprot:scaffold5029_cov224-Pinguiococcus_pyrenoidosus.AAC.3
MEASSSSPGEREAGATEACLSLLIPSPVKFLTRNAMRGNGLAAVRRPPTWMTGMWSSDTSSASRACESSSR